MGSLSQNSGQDRQVALAVTGFAVEDSLQVPEKPE